MLQINRMHTTYNNYDTITRDSIRTMTRGQKMMVATLFGTYADFIAGSSFGGFKIDSIMSPSVSVSCFNSYI